ncbi:MAG: aminoacyl-tRNA hydrolase [Phycisphaerae bacterium]|nr:aminoacyl-tRNA hydrolase [Phycisphaerae bacterium]
MKLIVGLGNPGTQYEKTRHNAGFLVVDELAKRHGAGAIAQGKFQATTLQVSIGGERGLLMKPTTFMNLSGKSVGEAVRFFKLDPAEDIVVAVDDLALDVGMIRVRAKGGDGGQNGLKDISRVLGSDAYPRVRVGIGKTPAMINQADWVLSRFTDAEGVVVASAVKQAADAIETLIAEGVNAAMNRHNTKAPSSKPPKGHPAQERSDPADASDNSSPARDSGARSANDDIHPGWTSSGT